MAELLAVPPLPFAGSAACRQCGPHRHLVFSAPSSICSCIQFGAAGAFHRAPECLAKVLEKKENCSSLKQSWTPMAKVLKSLPQFCTSIYTAWFSAFPEADVQGYPQVRPHQGSKFRHSSLVYKEGVFDKYEMVNTFYQVNHLNYVSLNILLTGCSAPSYTLEKWLYKVCALLCIVDYCEQSLCYFHLMSTNEYNVQFCIAVCLK